MSALYLPVQLLRYSWWIHQFFRQASTCDTFCKLRLSSASCIPVFWPICPVWNAIFNIQMVWVIEFEIIWPFWLFIYGYLNADFILVIQNYFVTVQRIVEPDSGCKKTKTCVRNGTMKIIPLLQHSISCYLLPTTVNYLCLHTLSLPSMSSCQ